MIHVAVRDQQDVWAAVALEVHERRVALQMEQRAAKQRIAQNAHAVKLHERGRVTSESDVHLFCDKMTELWRMS